MAIADWRGNAFSDAMDCWFFFGGGLREIFEGKGFVKGKGEGRREEKGGKGLLMLLGTKRVYPMLLG